MTNEVDYDAIVQRIGEQRDTQVGNSIYNASVVDPNKAAKAQDLAKTTGLPPQTTLNDYDDIVRRFKASQATVVVKDAPTLAQHLTDQNTANIVHDDLPNASGIEQTLRKKGLIEDALDAIGNTGKKVAGAALGGIYGLRKSIHDTISPNTPDQVGDMGSTYAKNLVRQANADPATRWTGELAGGMAYVPFMELAPFVIAGAEGNAGAQQLKDQGADDNTANVVGGLQGAILGAVQKIPMGNVLFGEGVKTFAKSVGGAALKAGAVGAGQSVVGDSVAQQVLEKNGYGELSKEYAPSFEKAWDSALFMGGVHLGMQGVHGVLSHRPKIPAELVQASVDAAKAEESFKTLSNLSKLAAESKWRERDPEGFKQFIKSVTDDGELTDVYVEGKSFAQALEKGDITPDEVRELMPDVASQMNKALQTEGFVRIPTEDYLTHIAGTELDKALLPHLKEDPQGKTYAEAQKIYETHAEDMKALAVEAIKEQSKADAFKESQDRVQAKILEDLNNLGRFPKDVNKVKAAFQSRIFSNLAKKEGVTPEEIFTKYGTNLKGEPITGESFLQGEEEGPFGKIFTEHHHDAQGAIDKLTQEKGGEAVGALHHPDIGDIDLVWGKEGTGASDGYGLAKLLKFHPEVVKDLQNIVSGMNVVTEGKNRKVLESPTHSATIRLDWNKESKKWLLTAYEKGGVTDTRTDTTDIGVKGDTARLNDASLKILTDDIEKFKQDKRGSYTPKTRTIALYKDANLTTFEHEVLHSVLDTYSHLAKTNPRIRAEMDILLKNQNIESLEKWNEMSIDEQRPHHEALAKMFEKYFMEGVAPSVELRPIFARIKTWMIDFYKSLRALNVELTPEVRGVFDRMLASEEEIQQAEADRVFEPFKEKPEGTSDEAWAEYLRLGEEGTQEAIDTMQAKSLRDMKWARGAESKTLKAMQREAASARRKVREEVAKEVAQEPIEQARTWLKSGEYKTPDGEEVKAEKGFKLNLEAVKELFPESSLDRPDLAKLKGLTEKDGQHPDVVADMFGFSSGEQLVRELIEGESTLNKIEGLTDRRMLEQHGELSSPQAIDDAVSAAIHNEARGRFMATGLKILAKSPIPARELLRGAKEAADAAIGSERVKDTNPRQYEVAEAKANKQAILEAPRDPRAAIQAQRAALLNNQLAKSAREALTKSDKIVQYFKKFDKPSIREKLPGSFLEQIDEIRARFDFRQVPSTSNRPKENLLRWADGLREMGYEPQIADWLTEFDQGKHYKELTNDELSGVYDSVRSIEATAKNFSEITRNGERVALDEVIKELSAKMDERGQKFTKEDLINKPDARVDGRWKALTHWIGTKLRQVDADLTPQEFKFNRFDMHDLNGVFREVLLDPIIQSNYNKVDMTKAVSDQAAKVGEELGRDWQKAMFDLVNNQTLIDPRLSEPGKPPVMMKITRAKLLGIMRHLGNESNFDKLVTGYGWQPKDVWKFVMDNATEKDWKATQAHWDSFDPLWAKTEEMVKRLAGVPAPKIAAREFDTPFGKMKGGYSPIDYDPVASKLSERKGEFDLQPGDKVAGEGMLYRATTTSNSSLIARSQGYTDYVNLDLHSADARIRDTIHDLAYREALLDATKIINHPKFREKFQLTYGREEYQAITGWLKDIRDMYLIDPKNRGFENALQYTRQGVVLTGIAYRLSTVAKHGSGAGLKSLGYLGNAAGAKYFAARVVRMASGHLQEDIALAKEKFSEIRTRLLQMDRDYKQGNRTMIEAEGWREKNDRFGHAMVAWSDALSAIPTAWAAYDLAINEGVPKSMGGTGKPMTEEQAVKYANSVVRQAHGSALESTRSNFLQSKGVKGLFGTLYGFMNNSYGQTRDMYDKAFKGGAFENNPALVARALATVIVPGLVAHWVSTGGVKEEEEWYEWALKAVGAEVAGMVPFVRDAASMIEYNQGGDVAPMRVIKDAYLTGKDLVKEFEGDDSKIIRDLANAVGEWAHIGGLGQAGKTLQYLRDVYNGVEDPEDTFTFIHDAALGPKHEK